MTDQEDQQVVEAIRRSTRIIVTTVVLSALAVMLFTFWLRNQEPYWKCRSLDNNGVSGAAENELWDQLRCGIDPELLPPNS